MDHFTIFSILKGIDGVEDLAAQNQIKYGTVRSSAVQKYFESQKVDPFAKMARFMEVQDTNVQTAAEGIQKVRASNNLTGKELKKEIINTTSLRFLYLTFPKMS